MYTLLWRESSVWCEASNNDQHHLPSTEYWNVPELMMPSLWTVSHWAHVLEQQHLWQGDNQEKSRVLRIGLFVQALASGWSWRISCWLSHLRWTWWLDWMEILNVASRIWKGSKIENWFLLAGIYFCFDYFVVSKSFVQ